jgi:hypothetical protein
LEEVAARTWNVLNEGKPFTVVFFLIVFALSGPSLGGLLAAAPLGLVWWRQPYPLNLRVVLWAVAAGVVAGAGGVSFGVAAFAVGLYLFFTVVLWGTLYYHLRLGAPWTNFARFSRLVIENPDPTSGNPLRAGSQGVCAVGAGSLGTAVAGLVGHGGGGTGGGRVRPPPVGDLGSGARHRGSPLRPPSQSAGSASVRSPQPQSAPGGHRRLSG